MKAKIIKNYHKTILISLLILFLSLVNLNDLSTPVTLLFSNADKVVHFIMYFSLSLILTLEFWHSQENVVSHKKIFLINLFPIIMSIAIELIQEYMTQARSGSLADAVSNIVGVVVAIIVFNQLKESKIIKKLIRFPFKA